MKRILLIISALVLCANASRAIDQEDNVYKIATAEDLSKFASIVNEGETTASAIVTADIDISSGTSFTPIGKSDKMYAGTFDGGYHNIKLNITDGGENQGLFGVTCGCTITSVTVCGTVTGTSNVGGIVGYVRGTNDRIDKCINNATVTGTGAYVGGIVGHILPSDGSSTEDEQGTIMLTACANWGNVSGGETGKTGSLIGLAENTNLEMTACYNEQVASGLAMYGNDSEIDGFATTDCYDINVGVGEEDDVTGAFGFSTSEMRNGTLCGSLNQNYSYMYSYEDASDDSYEDASDSPHVNASDGPWYQQIGKDEHPLLTMAEDEANVVSSAWLKEYGNDEDEGHIVGFNNDSKIELNDDATKFYELQPIMMTDAALGNIKYNCTEKAKNILVYDNESWYCGYAELIDGMDYKVEYDYEAAKFVYDRTLTTTNKGINTFMLPIETSVGNVNGKVYKLSTYSKGTLHFDEVTDNIEAGVPYLVENTTTTSEEKLLTGVLEKVSVKGIGESAMHSISTSDGNATQYGTYSKTTSSDEGIAERFDDQAIYGYTGGQFVKATGTWTMPAFRTLIAIPNTQAANAAALNIDLEGADINGVASIKVETNTPSEVYSVTGMKVRTCATADSTLDGLPAGLYIVNGKKMMKK